MTQPNILLRAVSAAVYWYCEKSPVRRGQWKLRRWTQPFLVARLADGPWIRVSGQVGQEWDLLLRKQKESATAQWFRSLVSPGMTVLDVGANIGCYSLMAAERVGPGGVVVAYEPTPSVVKCFRANIRLNRFSNITIVEGVVSDQEGTAVFHLNPEHEGSEGNSLIPALVVPGGTRITCPQTTLDAEVERLKLTRVDVVKIDVEGHEVRVLQGARRLLRELAPHLLLEVNPLTLKAGGSSPEALFAELTRAGYVWRTVEEMAWKDVVVQNVQAFSARTK